MLSRSNTGKKQRNEAVCMLSKYSFFDSFSAMLSMAAAACLAVVSVDLIMLGVILVAMGDH